MSAQATPLVSERLEELAPTNSETCTTKTSSYIVVIYSYINQEYKRKSSGNSGNESQRGRSPPGPGELPCLQFIQVQVQTMKAPNSHLIHREAPRTGK